MIGRKVIHLAERRWLAFHKPLGVVTTADDEGAPDGVRPDPRHHGLTYVGRLDVMTTGLLLLTTDGEAVHRLTHPQLPDSAALHRAGARHATAELAARVEGVVKVDDRPVVPSRVHVKAGRDGRSILDVTLAEGRNRIVRRWVEAMGAKVERLARLSYGPVRLGDLRGGQVAAAHPGRRARDLSGHRHEARRGRVTLSGAGCDRARCASALSARTSWSSAC